MPTVTSYHAEEENSLRAGHTSKGLFVDISVISKWLNNSPA
jgi:hypothetical protein